MELVLCLCVAVSVYYCVCSSMHVCVRALYTHMWGTCLYGECVDAMRAHVVSQSKHTHTNQLYSTTCLVLCVQMRLHLQILANAFVIHSIRFVFSSQCGCIWQVNTTVCTAQRIGTKCFIICTRPLYTHIYKYATWHHQFRPAWQRIRSCWLLGTVFGVRRSACAQLLIV